MKSIDELLTRIHTARKRIGISKHPAWYRGHSHGFYKLIPSLFRYKIGLKHERNMMSVFMNEAGDLIPSSFQSSWEILALMQHHGTPTRLLDWSESIDVAIYFAICEKCKNPTIWVLNPFRLNYQSVGKNIIFDKSDPIFYDFYTEIRDKQKVPHELPIAINPPWVNPRIKRQKGCFTVHGSDTKTMESFSGNFVKRVYIPQQLVKELRKYLRNKRMDDFELFPDLDGLSRSLKKRFRLT
jgi:hypothetical protein